MNIPYRIAANVEWTSKCNAACAMCPRDAIERPQSMSLATWRQVLARLAPDEIFRVVLAGHGEPTTHPRFFEFIDVFGFIIEFIRCLFVFDFGFDNW